MSQQDYFFHEKKVVPIDKAIKFETELYRAAGMSEADARCVADALVDADARGVYSHGIQRNSLYLNRFKKGGTSPTARPETVKQFGATALVDGNNAMGMVVSKYGMELASLLELSTATVSHHMALLLEAGFVSIRRESNRVYYELNRKKVRDFLDELRIALIGQ